MLSLLLLLPALPSQEPAPPAPQIYPLAIEDVVRLVQENAPALRQARLQALAAEGGALEAQGAFGTVFFADATYNYAEQPSGGFFTAFGDTETRTLSLNEGLRRQLATGGTFTLSANQTNRDANYLPESQSDVNFGFRYVQPLLRGGWELSATRDRRRAEYAADRSRASIRRANVEAVQQAVDAYWDLAFALADVEVKRGSLQLADELREMTQAKLDVGAVAEVEVVQTEADIASRMDALLGAQNLVHQAQDRLRALLFGLDEDEQWRWELMPRSEPPAPVTAELDWQAAMETAREYRADLRELRVDVRGSRLEWQAARRDLLPQLDFTAEGNLYEQDDKILEANADLIQYDFPGYALGLVFEIPLDSSQYDGAERRTRWDHQLALRRLRDLEIEISVAVRDAVRDVDYQAQRVAITSRAREVAQRQLDAEQRRLVEGASTNFQVLQFQTDLSVAASQEVQAQMDYAKAVVKLNTVRGLNWDGSRPDLAGLEDYRPGSEFAD